MRVRAGIVAMGVAALATAMLAQGVTTNVLKTRHDTVKNT